MPHRWKIVLQYDTLRLSDNICIVYNINTNFFVYIESYLKISTVHCIVMNSFANNHIQNNHVIREIPFTYTKFSQKNYTKKKY